MKLRNFSPQTMFIRLAAEHTPLRAFTSQETSFATWKESTLPLVLATLGDPPSPVDPDPELLAEWQDRGITKRRYALNVGPHISAVVQVNLPNGASGVKSPALLCWHGHGLYGKDPVMGNVGIDGVKDAIRAHNYDYGHQLAENGFITYAIDWMGCGDRNDQEKPHFLNTAGQRDWCNLYYLHATMLGTTPLALNLAHGRVATDFVCTLPEVDAGNLGVIGMSGGGTMALWTALTDPRFKAIEIVCYSDLWALFGIRDINYCGSQVSPGLFKLVDLPDLQGLLAPLPLLVDIGAYDKCFMLDNATACFRQVEKIYTASGAREHLHLDLFPGDHAWGANKSEAFFRQYLLHSC